MFPTLSYLVKYLTGLTLPLPIPTFGLLMCAAFIAAYYLFKSEFKRKERLGILHTITIFQNTRTSLLRQLFTNAFVPFIVGYKLVYLLAHFSMFAANPQAALLSTSGNWSGGIVAAIIVIGYAIYKQRKELVKQRNKSSAAVIHPYQLMDALLFWCGVSGFAGALLFAKFDYLPQIIANPSKELFAYHGMVFLGALIGGATAYFIILTKHSIPFLVAADVGSPGMMAAYSIGRLGCHLAGDGDWGIVNNLPKPSWLHWLPESLWKSNYPHNAIHEGLMMSSCTDNFCNVLPAPVFPTSFYEFCICFLLFVFLWSIRKHLPVAGTLFFIYIIIFGIERYLIEFIRINPEYCFLHFCFSQAQWISILLITGGAVGLFILLLQGKLVIGNDKNFV